jgi:REP element-mobilizing transposase RayT
MILGYHVVFGAYGFWLPNDPRGSWSEFVGSWELFRFGPATTTEGRLSVAHAPHDTQARLAAKQALQRPAVQFTGLQARAVARGFGNFVQRRVMRCSPVTVLACAILPEHVHLVIGRHHYEVEKLVNLLKGAATRQLVEEKIHPFGELPARRGRVPKCWAEGLWKVYLNSEADVVRAIEYVEQNSIKEGKPLQRWWFVTPCYSVRHRPRLAGSR